MPDGDFHIQPLFEAEMSAKLLGDIKARNQMLHRTLTEGFKNSQTMRTSYLDDSKEKAYE